MQQQLLLLARLRQINLVLARVARSLVVEWFKVKRLGLFYYGLQHQATKRESNRNFKSKNQVSTISVCSRACSRGVVHPVGTTLSISQLCQIAIYPLLANGQLCVDRRWVEIGWLAGNLVNPIKLSTHFNRRGPAAAPTLPANYQIIAFSHEIARELLITNGQSLLSSSERALIRRFVRTLLWGFSIYNHRRQSIGARQGPKGFTE